MLNTVFTLLRGKKNECFKMQHKLVWHVCIGQLKLNIPVTYLTSLVYTIVILVYHMSCQAKIQFKIIY